MVALILLFNISCHAQEAHALTGTEFSLLPVAERHAFVAKVDKIAEELMLVCPGPVLKITSKGETDASQGLITLDILTELEEHIYEKVIAYPDTKGKQEVAEYIGSLLMKDYPCTPGILPHQV